MSARAIVLATVVALLAASHQKPAHAQPNPPSIGSTLREGNAAAAAGDWARVSALVDPVLTTQLVSTDLAEAHRLAGLAAFFQQRPADADRHFLAYLRIDLDGQLDPSIYPPEAISFLALVRANHAVELRALRPKVRGSIWLSLLPPVGQFQNGDRTKGIVIGSLLGALVIANVTSVVLLRSWCTKVTGSTGDSRTCDDNGEHFQGANNLRALNIVSGIGLITTYLYGVYDGVSTYRQRRREAQITPYVTGGFVGVAGAF